MGKSSLRRVTGGRAGVRAGGGCGRVCGGRAGGRRCSSPGSAAARGRACARVWKAGWPAGGRRAGPRGACALEPERGSPLASPCHAGDRPPAVLGTPRPPTAVSYPGRGEGESEPWCHHHPLSEAEEIGIQQRRASSSWAVTSGNAKPTSPSSSSAAASSSVTRDHFRNHFASSPCLGQRFHF